MSTPGIPPALLLSGTDGQPMALSSGGPLTAPEDGSQAKHEIEDEGVLLPGHSHP